MSIQIDQAKPTIRAVDLNVICFPGAKRNSQKIHALSAEDLQIVESGALVNSKRRGKPIASREESESPGICCVQPPPQGVVHGAASGHRPFPWLHGGKRVIRLN